MRNPWLAMQSTTGRGADCSSNTSPEQRRHAGVLEKGFRYRRRSCVVARSSVWAADHQDVAVGVSEVEVVAVEDFGQQSHALLLEVIVRGLCVVGIEHDRRCPKH